MRARLTLAFVGLAVVLLAVVGLARSAATADMVRSGAEKSLVDHTTHVAAVLDERYEAGEPVGEEHLVALTSPTMEVRVTRPGEPEVVVRGARFDPGDLGDALRTTRTVGATTVSVVESDHSVRSATSERVSVLLAMVMALVLAAGVAGWFLARWLARPVAALADGAAALGRGRFDLDLPVTRIPEVRAVAAAMEDSATRLRTSIQRDREYLQHASHVLRTPLTGLRLELEEALLLHEPDDDLRQTLARSLADVKRLQDTVTELVEFERGRPLVEGAAVSVAEVVEHVAARWRGRLPVPREVRAIIDSGEDLMVTPGPIEQLMDSVLADVAAHGPRAVSLSFEADPTHLRVRMASEPGAGPTPAADRPSALRARALVELLGGRWVGDPVAGGLEILLPRR